MDLWTSYKYVWKKNMYVLRLKLEPENLLVPVSRSIVYILGLAIREDAK